MINAADEAKRGRVLILRRELQNTISAEVKAADPGCAAFVGVIVERIGRQSPVGANWEIKGVRFGEADREIAGNALSTVVERLQGEVDLDLSKDADQ